MKKNKLLKILVLIGVLVLLLAACGGGANAVTGNNSDANSSGSNTNNSGQDTSGTVDDPYCGGGEIHPIAQSIAGTYEVSYEEIIGYFCDGYYFENILLALETSRQSDRTPLELLEWNVNTPWEDIWEELGLNE